MVEPREDASRSSAPTRFVVWVLCAIYLGRFKYNNSLYDLRQLAAGQIAVRTVAIAMTTGFVYWNLAVVDARAAIYIWTTVALFYGGVLILWGVIEAGVDYAEARDPLERRKHTEQLDEDDKRFETVRRFAADGRLDD